MPKTPLALKCTCGHGQSYHDRSVWNCTAKRGFGSCKCAIFNKDLGPARPLYLMTVIGGVGETGLEDNYVIASFGYGAPTAEEH